MIRRPHESLLTVIGGMSVIVALVYLIGVAGR